MFARVVLAVACLAVLGRGIAPGQMTATPRIPADEVFDRVLARNVLTFHGKPFHAVLEIAEEKGDPAYTGAVELFWADSTRYRVHVTSPHFEQTLIVDGKKVQEDDQGDFYPGWLQNFVTALLTPMPRLADLRGRGLTVAIGQGIDFACVKRDDRPGGITDEMTWARVCFTGSQPDLQFALDFTYEMTFKNTRNFAGKSVPTEYTTRADEGARLHGTLVQLQTWQPEDALLSVSTPTLPEHRILTSFVSTAKEESLLEHAPENVAWPAVRDGKTDGYMIVEALTDRTGQVREASKHNSDNPLLEDFGRRLALQYKFKPLLVDGVPQQMAMPLVLHFVAAQGKPLPELNDEETRKRVTGCDLPHEIEDRVSAGNQVQIRFYVESNGNLSQISISDRGVPLLQLYGQFRPCRFGVLQDQGEAIPYYANLQVMAR